MAKSKTRWVCQECGFQASRFLGKCTECNSWNSLVEEFDADPSTLPIRERPNPFSGAAASSGPQALTEIEAAEHDRLPTSIATVDEVLGGGLVPGSVILLAGDPGVGKSTFLLQVANILAKHNRVLYISAEESKQQVRMRAQRLGMQSPNILIDSEHNVATIQQRMAEHDVRFVVVDSIQAVFHPEITSAPGSVSQVRESAGSLVTAAKANGICMVLVGHVTKDGTIAGPRVLEHMVDVVLHFEGDPGRNLRILRAVKNRFGSTHEIAIFTMNEGGLQEVDNASALFLGERLSKNPGERAPSGTAVLAACEGNRSLLLEVQALVGASAAGTGRRVANGCDYNRVLQIIAVLEKRVGLALAKQDVYVNIVGGFEFGDPAGDLAIAVATATSCLDRSVDPFLVCIGELGLSGELRPVAQIERRLREAERMGFKRALVPAANLPMSEPGRRTASPVQQMELIAVDYLSEALHKIMPGLDDKRRARAEKSADTSGVPPAATSIETPIVG
ncbi:MAG TPA: DNA repair protein RadA [Candidatus Obscuribacterales bacterium]